MNRSSCPYGIRGLSKHYEENPYTYREGDEEGTINYSPADSPVPMFGGNSNWRGPVWLPINYLIIEALQKYAHYFGDDLKMEFPTGSGNWLNLWEISLRLEERLINLFRRNQVNARPFNGSISYFDDDPHWKDLIRFNEYFHGDNGRGRALAIKPDGRHRLQNDYPTQPLFLVRRYRSRSRSLNSPFCIPPFISP